MNLSVLPPLDRQQRYSILEASAYLRVSRAYLYRLIKDGDVRVVRDGSRTFVPGSEIARRSELIDKSAA